MSAIRQLVTTTVKRIGPHTQDLSAHKYGQGFCQHAAAAAGEQTLVIFDKDGTLVTFENSWIEWIIDMSDKYAEYLGKPVQQELYHLMGFNAATKRFGDGLICDTDENIMKTLGAYLQRKHGMRAEEAAAFVQSNFFSYKTSLHESVPVDDPYALITDLKRRGIKVAVCTSDSARGNDAMVKDFGLGGLLDFSLCGDEPEMRPKPDAGNIHYICKKVGVAVSDTFMVGDSLRDMEMGKAAGVRASIGVLSGVCDEERLQGVADVIIPSIKHILPIVIPDYKE